MNRRDLFKQAGWGTAAGLLGFITSREAAHAETAAQPPPGLAPLKITKVRPILTAPQTRIRFVVV